METFTIGTAEAIEAEYGSVVDAPYGLIVFYNGEIQDVLPFATIEAAKTELSWVEDRSTVSYL